MVYHYQHRLGYTCIYMVCMLYTIFLQNSVILETLYPKPLYE